MEPSLIRAEAIGHRRPISTRPPGRCICGTVLSKYRPRGETRCTLCRENPGRFAQFRAAASGRLG